MAERQSTPPVPVSYQPQHGNRALPVEVLDRADVLARQTARTDGHRQRVGFNVLTICTAGTGTHVVDFVPERLRPGTVLRTHPGQVQRYVPSGTFEAVMVVWPADAPAVGASRRAWFPGSTDPTRWQVDGQGRARVLHALALLREEQGRFDGSPGHGVLLLALLTALLARVEVEGTTTATGDDRPVEMPSAYLELRSRLEQTLSERPTVAQLARDLGYSTRTLDRACRAVDGRTAKQVVDARVGLEVRRLLTHTDRPISAIAASFAFDDPSNFSKFVKRHLGALPGQIRQTG